MSMNNLMMRTKFYIMFEFFTDHLLEFSHDFLELCY